MSTVVHVKNISHQTSEKEVRDFFSFCGKITNISVTPTSGDADSTKSATVTFEKETAAKTALLLDHTQLGSSQVHVSSAANLDELAGGDHSGHGQEDGEDLDQEDKPRSRIAAEYLAHGYVLSDKALQNAIALDQKHGVSTRFMNVLNKFDAKYQATEKAKGIDASYGITDKAMQGWAGLNSYFEKAVGTPTGQKLAAFYSNGNRQVMDIHTEARRLADLKSGKSSSTSNTAAENEKNKTQIPGTNKTQCTCAGNEGTCACKPGECACSGCGKSSVQNEGNSATGAADSIAASSGMQPLGEKY